MKIHLCLLLPRRVVDGQTDGLMIKKHVFRNSVKQIRSEMLGEILIHSISFLI